MLTFVKIWFLSKQKDYKNMEPLLQALAWECSVRGDNFGVTSITGRKFRALSPQQPQARCWTRRDHHGPHQTTTDQPRIQLHEPSLPQGHQGIIQLRCFHLKISTPLPTNTDPWSEQRDSRRSSALDSMASSEPTLWYSRNRQKNQRCNIGPFNLHG